MMLSVKKKKRRRRSVCRQVKVVEAAQSVTEGVEDVAVADVAVVAEGVAEVSLARVLVGFLDELFFFCDRV